MAIAFANAACVVSPPTSRADVYYAVASGRHADVTTSTVVSAEPDVRQRRTAVVQPSAPHASIAAVQPSSVLSSAPRGEPAEPPAAVPPDALVSSSLQESPATGSFFPWARFGISLGGILTALDSSARIGVAGAGVSVDLEDLLGLDTSTSTYRLEAFWRFTKNRRHRLDLSWFDLSRRGSTVLENDLDLGGTVLPAGSGVGSVLDINLIRAQYSYSFFQDERFDLALSAGLYIAPIKFGLQASGMSTYSDSLSVTAPLPVFGLRTDFALTPKWYLRNDVSLFYLAYDNYTGSIADLGASVEYRMFDNVALGLGVNTFRLKIGAEEGTSVPGVDTNGEVNFAYAGVLLYLKMLW